MKSYGTYGLYNSDLSLRLVIDLELLEKIKHTVAQVPTEVQWFHTVRKVRKDNYLLYYIEGFYMPEQEANSTTVETSPTMNYDMYKEWCEKYGEEEADRITANLGVWCHSHGNMSPAPSGQDNDQFKEMCKNANDIESDCPQIMMIFNKKDEFYSRLKDPELGLVFENIPMVVRTPWNFDEINEEIKKKVKKKTYAPTGHFLGGYGNGYPFMNPPMKNGGKATPTKHLSKTDRMNKLQGIKSGITQLVNKINRKESDKKLEGLANSLYSIIGRCIDDDDIHAINTLMWGDYQAVEVFFEKEAWLTPRNQREIICDRDFFKQNAKQGLIPEQLILAMETVIELDNVYSAHQGQGILMQFLGELDTILQTTCNLSIEIYYNQVFEDAPLESENN